MHYPLRKGKKDPKDNSEISRATTPTTGPDCAAWEARLFLPWFQRAGPLPCRAAWEGPHRSRVGEARWAASAKLKG